MIYLLQYEEYLRDFQVSDFPDEESAMAGYRKLDEKGSDRRTIQFIRGDGCFRSPRFSAQMRIDIFNLMSEKEAEPGEKISAERLFTRLEIWMKE